MDQETFRPWRRNALAPELPDDDEAAWRAFEAYLVQPSRNLGRLARERRTPLEAVQRWAKRYAWAARVEAYDQHLADIRDDVIEASAADLARAASQMLQLGARELSLLAKLQAQHERPGTVTPRDALRAVDRGVLLLQLLAGRPTERTSSEEIDLSVLSEDELEQFAALREKITRPAGA